MAEAMKTDEENSTNCSGDKAEDKKKPTCIIVLGMAGSGKTTFVQVNFLIYTWAINEEWQVLKY